MERVTGKGQGMKGVGTKEERQTGSGRERALENRETEGKRTRPPEH